MVSKKKHILKTFTWRIISTLTTIFIAFFITGEPLIGLAIGGFEFFVKMPIYYLHERAWFRFFKYEIKKEIHRKRD